MSDSFLVTDWIPHREPFLFVDKILSIEEDQLFCTYEAHDKRDFFRGHYPDYPIMPGVLLQECIYQSGAIFLSQKMVKQSGNKPEGVPVVSRVKNVKYRSSVHPGDVLKIQVKLDEVVGSAYYMSGTIERDGKKVVSLDFTCMLLETSS